MSQRDLRVCFVGDSSVAGLGDSSALGWVGRVTIAALAEGLPITAYNLGVRKETSVQISQRIAAEIHPRLAPATDPRVVVSFGVNDTVLESGRLRIDTAETISALHRIHASVASMPLLLIGPPAVDDDKQNNRIASLDEALHAQAGALGVPFISCFAGTVSDAVWRQQIRDGDGFHPDADGYQHLADLITAPALKWLE